MNGEVKEWWRCTKCGKFTVLTSKGMSTTKTLNRVCGHCVEVSKHIYCGRVKNVRPK